MTMLGPTSPTRARRQLEPNVAPARRTARIDRHEALLRYLAAIMYQDVGQQGPPPRPSAVAKHPGPAGRAAATRLHPAVEELRGGPNALVADVMSSPVVAVLENASFKEMARTLATAGVSAVPVVDRANHVRGVVSEADLLAFAAGQSRRPANEHGPVAARLMTSPPITVTPDTPVAQAGRLAARRRVKRLPVVDGAGRLVGIVSRSDLLRVFLTPDAVIRDHVVNEVIRRRLCLTPDAVEVSVAGGVVTVAGQLEPRLMAILRREVLAVDGVVDMIVRHDS